MGGIIMDKQDEREKIIKNLSKYKLSLEDEVSELLKELSGYSYPKYEGNANQSHSGFREVEHIRYDNPYKTYLISQVQLANDLIPILNQHIASLKDGEGLDLVIESLEFNIYKIKKQIYTDVEEWQRLLYYLSEERLCVIEENPKGYGDLILIELNWLRKYEKRMKKNQDWSKNEGER